MAIPKFRPDPRIREYFEAMTTDVGMGDDPVGFLLASHAYGNYRRSEMAREIKKLREALEKISNATAVAFMDDPKGRGEVDFLELVEDKQEIAAEALISEDEDEDEDDG